MGELNGNEMMRIDADVCWALDKRPGETIEDAAKRVFAYPKGNPAWRVAYEILCLVPNREPWTRMARAAKAARRIQKRGRK